MESFESPQGFQEENVSGQLFLDDIDENSELWLVRMPSDIELSDINKKKIFLDQKFGSIVTKSGKILEFTTEACEIPDLCAILPERNDNKLQAVKKLFQGSVLITEGINLNENTVVKNEYGENEAADNSTSDSLKSKKSKKKKSKTGKTDSNDASQELFPGFLDEINVKREPLVSDVDEFPNCKSQV